MLWSFIFRKSKRLNPREFTRVCALELNNLLICSEPKEPNPREFTRACALEPHFSKVLGFYLALCGPICAYLALCGPSCAYLALCGHICAYLALCGHPFTYIYIYGSEEPNPREFTRVCVPER